MAQNFPKATIKSVRSEGDQLLVELSFDRVPTSPVVPAFLFGLTPSGEAPNRRALAVLEWCRASGDVWIFEAAKEPLEIAPEQSCGYQGIWTPVAYDAVADLGATWVRTQYPDDGTHEHCLITFATISSYKGEPVGYFCPKYGWISERAYEDHVVHDIYGVRARLREGRIPCEM